MEINATQAVGAAWNPPAAAGMRPRDPAAMTSGEPIAAQTPVPVIADPGPDSVILAEVAARPEQLPPPPAKPLEKPLQAFDLHPLASAAGRYPLVDKMLQDVFGLDATRSPAEGKHVDVAA